MTTKLHIGNIPRTSTVTDPEAIFRQFGLVDSINVTTDRLNFSQYAGHTIGVSRARNV